MTVDHHAINSLRVWFDIAYEEIKKEWKSNEYKIFLIVHPLKQPIPIEKL
ncbi:hypothetical protein [Neobacillus cucumis]|nr:hypothetical protein [Neobacillus cucumis]MBM7650988.1 hypothetical protein [Neobacillus cucumis]